MRKRPRKYFNDLYVVNFYFCIGWSRKEFREWAAKNFGCHQDLTSYHGFTVAGGGHCAIWVANKKDYSSLAHECVHAANYTLERAGVKPCFDNDEPHAYLVGLLVSRALAK